MKTIKLLGTAIAVVLLFSFTSCEEAKDVLPIPSMSATINGTAWSSLASVGVLTTNTTPQTISVTGKPTLEQNVDKTLVVTVQGTTAKTYNQSIVPVALECGLAYTVVLADQSTDVYISTESTVTITKMDAAKKMVDGTFSGELTNGTEVITVTNGKFENIIYTEQ